MNRILQIGSFALLAAGVVFGSDRQASKEQKTAPAPKGIPKSSVSKDAGRVLNPSNVAVRLLRMSPEEREHALEKLPTLQARENARKTLEWYDGLPKEQQEIQLHRLERFASFTPEKRAEFRQLLAAYNALPGNRKVAVGRELVVLQSMPDERRELVLHRPLFQARFSAEEYRIIVGLADAWMGPAN